jgi:hypothetical protein
MNIEAIPISVFFLLISILIITSMELGFRVASMIYKSIEKKKEAGQEMESPVSGISGSILGLLAFILVFTFNIVSERYDNKRRIVREEANSIRTTWMLSELLPEPDRSKTRLLIKEYIDKRVKVVQYAKSNRMNQLMAESLSIQNKLYQIAIINARKDLNSDIGALYIQSLNEMISLHFNRVSIGWQVRIPNGIWAVLFILIFLSMFAVGYQTAIAHSTRSWLMVVLAISFSLVITLIAVLDRPMNNLISIPQQPMIDLRTFVHQQNQNNNR